MLNQMLSACMQLQVPAGAAEWYAAAGARMCHQQQGGARFTYTCAPGCFLAAGFLAAGFLAGLNCASSSSLQTVKGRCVQVRLCRGVIQLTAMWSSLPKHQPWATPP